MRGREAKCAKKEVPKFEAKLIFCRGSAERSRVSHFPSEPLEFGAPFALVSLSDREVGKRGGRRCDAFGAASL